MEPEPVAGQIVAFEEALEHWAVLDSYPWEVESPELQEESHFAVPFQSVAAVVVVGQSEAAEKDLMEAWDEIEVPEAVFLQVASVLELQTSNFY